ncbi:MAG: hypothetical protein LBL62_08840 [Planctomycetaceae bacterium]|nr:hypothetical protein [Planctomycetaceae bacterium]
MNQINNGKLCCLPLTGAKLATPTQPFSERLPTYKKVTYKKVTYLTITCF